MSNEPTLGMIQRERAAQAAEAAALRVKQEEEARIAKKRRMLAGLAQGLEELDHEIAAAKKLRKELKTGIADMKLVRESMTEFENVDDLSYEDIEAYVKTVRDAIGKSPTMPFRDRAFVIGIDYGMDLGSILAAIPKGSCEFQEAGVVPLG